MSAGDFRGIGPLPQQAQSPDNSEMKIDSGDTAWVLASAALVMLMTPALGFFYGGLVRRKNVLSTIMHSFFILCLISVQWVLWGYSLAFGPDKFHIIGGLEWVGLNNVGFTPNADYAPTIPHQAFMVFQMMFAVITPALISGAFAERQRFKAFVLFSLLWAGGCTTWARSTSPEARSFTSAPAYRRWLPRSSSAGASALASKRQNRTTPP
jgi:hypothetical protein